MAGRTDVPILFGSTSRGVDTPSEASSFIVEQAHKYPGEVKILAVGALTNVATAIHTDPDIVYLLQEVVTVGGNLVKERITPTPGSPYDLNYGVDPVCARLVFESGVPVTVVSIALCRNFILTWSDLRKATDGDTPLDGYLRRSSRSWMLLKGGKTVPWDLVGLSYIVRPDWYSLKRAKVNFHVHNARRPVVAIEINDLGLNDISILGLQDDNVGEITSWIGGAI